jgi:hypothetical protein
LASHHATGSPQPLQASQQVPRLQAPQPQPWQASQQLPQE